MVAFAVALAGGVYVVGQAIGMWDAAEPSAGTEGPVIPAGWRIHRAAGIKIALPPSWKVLDPRENWDSSAFRRQNPELAKYIGVARRGRSPNNKLMAFDTSRLAAQTLRRDGFATNLGIIKAPVADPRAAMWKRNLVGLRGIPGRIGPVESRRVTLADRAALSTRVRTEARSTTGRVVLSTAQWSVVEGGYEYVITFGTTRGAERRYAGFVKQMLATLELPKPSKRPPPGSFASRANRICDSHLPPASARELEEAPRTRVIARVIAAQVRALRALEPPAALARKCDLMLRYAARLPGEMRRYADSLDAGDKLGAGRARTRGDRAAKAASKLARELGLASCA
jgi:hypothetical protein